MKPKVRLRSSSRSAVGQVVDAPAVEQDRAVVGRVERAEQVQQRALARPGRADDREELAVLDLEVDAAQHRDHVLALAVGLVQLDRRAGGSPSSLRDDASRGDAESRVRDARDPAPR